MSNQLEPGPELDALMAEKVMGWTRRVFSGQNPKSLWDDKAIFKAMDAVGHTHEEGKVPPYSTSITAAMEEVIQNLQGRGMTVLISCPHSGNLHSVLVLIDHGARSYGPSEVFWHVADETEVSEYKTKSGDSFTIGRHEQATEKDLPHAICLAALKAVGYLN